VYFTLIPVFAVKSDGVKLAMSCICGLATMATLIVFFVLVVLFVFWPDAAATSDAAATAPTAVSAIARILRLRTLPTRCFCMVAASSYADDGSRVERA
jgi:uncharacterized membrane protein YfcA